MKMNSNGTSVVTTFEPFSTPQRRGVIVIAVFALLSTLALTLIAFRTIQLALMLFLERDGYRKSRPPEMLFFRTQLGHYAGSLVLSNMFISAAGLVDFRWVARSGLTRGSTCSAQAVLMHIGIWSTCWFMAAHGVHTLSSLGFHVRPARWRSIASVVVGWIIAFVAGLAPLHRRNVYGPTGTSCSITHSHSKEIFVLEALPIILGGIVSIVVYSVIFIVLYRKKNAKSAQKLRSCHLTTRRGEDISEEYNRFIRMIIRTMFWFPLAFVLLSLPFCITHIIMHAGHSVHLALSVFADVCISMLGFVNVGLLCNTLRVISPVYRGGGRVAAETVKTFGNDASGESPTRPKFRSQFVIPSQERRMYNSTQLSSNHTYDSSWSSLNSHTELLRAEKGSYKSTQTKIAPLVLNNIVPPAELSREFNNNLGAISPQSSTKKQDNDSQLDTIVNSPLRTVSLSARSRVSFFPGCVRHEPSTQDEKCLFQPTTDTDTLTKAAKDPTFKSKIPSALSLSPVPGLPPPPRSWRYSNMPAALAARLAVPITPACAKSQIPTVPLSQKLDKEKTGASAFPVKPILLIGVNTWSPDNADESNFRSSSFSSPSSIAAHSTTSKPDCSGEVMDVREVRPLPQTPEPSEEQDIVGSCPPTKRSMRARSCRATMASVWSQETGYTMSQLPDEEIQEACRQLITNALVPGVMLSDQAGVGGVMNREATPGADAHPKTHVHPANVASRLSACLSHTLSPKSPHSKPSTMTVAANDSVV